LVEFIYSNTPEQMIHCSGRNSACYKNFLPRITQINNMTTAITRRMWIWPPMV